MLRLKRKMLWVVYELVEKLDGRRNEFAVITDWALPVTCVESR